MGIHLYMYVCVWESKYTDTLESLRHAAVKKENTQIRWEKEKNVLLYFFCKYIDTLESLRHATAIL